MTGSRPLQPCMGGWCLVRLSCGHYHSNSPYRPDENLCRRAPGSRWMPVYDSEEQIREHHALSLIHARKPKRAIPIRAV